MSRPLHEIRSFRLVLSLVVALGLGLSRSEKLWAQSLDGMTIAEAAVTEPHRDHDAFDPRRVPASGGSASRLLAGLSAKP